MCLHTTDVEEACLTNVIAVHELLLHKEEDRLISKNAQKVRREASSTPQQKQMTQ